MLIFKRNDEPMKAALRYTACGLDVYLCNGFTIETIDGEEYVTIADLDGLWQAIREPKETKSDQTVARWVKLPDRL